MSTRSYPAGFVRQPREEPVFDSAEHKAMMTRLNRRCAEVEARKVPRGTSVSGTASVAPSGDQTDVHTAIAGHGASAPHGKTSSAGGESQSPVVGELPQLSRPVSTPGAILEGEDSTFSAESSRPQALKWLKPQGEAVRTQCGLYVVARVVINGSPRYELRTWVQERDLLGSWKLLDGQCADFDVAKLLAQRHADAQCP